MTAIDGEIVLVRPNVDYEGICAAMFHPIRQNAGASAAILIRMMEVFVEIAQIERRIERLALLMKHAQLVVEAGERNLLEPAASADLAAPEDHLDEKIDAERRETTDSDLLDPARPTE